MRKLEVVRTVLPAYTPGHLFLDSAFQCFTLEDPVRETKIDGETAIPFGEYDALFYPSPAFKMTVILLLNVPGFDMIEFHPGNTIKDTKGCILTGQGYKDGLLWRSRKAFEALMKQLKPTDQLKVIVR